MRGARRLFARGGRKPAVLLVLLLALGTMPLAAFAMGRDADARLQPALGTYRDHEAIAYVVDGGSDGITPYSRGDDALSGAVSLMDIDSSSAREALDHETASATEAAARGARSAASGGNIVLVRDESKSTQELIAELSEDPRVLIAEPNYTVQDPAEESAPASGPRGTQGDIASLAGSPSAPVDTDAAAPDLTSLQWAYNNDGTSPPLPMDSRSPARKAAMGKRTPIRSRRRLAPSPLPLASARLRGEAVRLSGHA